MMNKNNLKEMVEKKRREKELKEKQKAEAKNKNKEDLINGQSDINKNNKLSNNVLDDKSSKENKTDTKNEVVGKM